MGAGSVERMVAPYEVEKIVQLFELVASQEGWRPGDQLRSQTRYSCIFGLVSPNGQLIGGLQLNRTGEDGRLPCQVVWPELTFHCAQEVAHVGVLAVLKEWRGHAGGLFWLLAAEMWRHCVLEGIREIWLEATPRTMRCYERLGWPLQIRGPLREHWGEKCYICSLDVREVAGELAERAVRSDAYRAIMTGAIARRPPAADVFESS